MEIEAQGLLTLYLKPEGDGQTFARLIQRIERREPADFLGSDLITIFHSGPALGIGNRYHAWLATEEDHPGDWRQKLLDSRLYIWQVISEVELAEEVMTRLSLHWAQSVEGAGDGT